MKLNQHTISFQKNSVIVQELAAIDDNTNLVATINSELMQFGYTLSKDAFEKLSHCQKEYILSWTNEIMTYLKEVLGEGNYKPFHPNFPMSVKEMSECELYLYAIMHYWSVGTWFPSEELIEKGYKYEHTNFTQISPISFDSFKRIFTDLVSVNQALSPQNVEIVDWFIKEYGVANAMPKEVPFKETLCKLASNFLRVPVKTSTDVLRIAQYMSNGKTDLVVPPKEIQPNAWLKRYKVKNPEYDLSKFKKFNRKERRYLLSLLDNVANKSEMILRKEMWLRLGEILHPGEYKDSFPKSFEAFDSLRNSSVQSWYGYVYKGFGISYQTGITRLMERPGEFARKLDSLIRNNPMEIYTTLDSFLKISDKISNKVIFELIQHFQNRLEEKERKIFIKGSRKATLLPSLSPLHQSIVDRIIETLFDSLSSKFSKKDKLGNVYLDEKLKKIALPLSMRGISFSTKPCVRGTKNPLLSGKKVVRVYLHWTAGVDLDLSVELYTQNNRGATCSFHNLRPCKGIYHSGDVIPRIPGNWAEYVDIVLDEIPYQYALIEVRNFRGGSLKDKGAILGFMEREFPESNTTWYPKTITSAYSLSSSGTSCCLALIDIKNREWTLIDEDTNGIPVSFGDDVEKYVETYMKDPKYSVYDLLKLHIDSRNGSLVDDKEKADIIFTFEDFSESYEKIYEYMQD